MMDTQKVTPLVKLQVTLSEELQGEALAWELLQPAVPPGLEGGAKISA